jgi:hypothetical protein
LSCHCSRHVEYLQEISCCFKQWDAAITSTRDTSVASCRVIKPVSSTLRDAYQEICPQQSPSLQHHDVQYWGLCRQIPSLTLEVSHNGQQWIGRVALDVQLPYIILLIDCCVPRYVYTHIQLHAGAYSCFFQCHGWFLYVRPG